MARMILSLKMISPEASPPPIMPAAATLLWGDRDPHRYYLFIGASAFVFSAEQECRRLFGVAPRDAEFVERHTDLAVALLLDSPQPG